MVKVRDKSSGFRRPSAGAVRKSIKDGPKGGGGPPLFNLPDGMGQFEIKKPGIFKLNLVPYGVMERNHPERVQRKSLWYRRMIRVHRPAGGGSIVCPSSVDSMRKCLWCKAFFKLKKELEEGNEELNAEEMRERLKPFSGQPWDLFYVLDPKDNETVMLYATSYGKFGKALKNYIELPQNKKHALFFETNKDGRTIKGQFNEKTFQKSKFIECTAILAMLPREPLNDDKIIGQTVCLSKIPNVLDDETLKKMFYQTDEDDSKPDSEEKVSTGKKKKFKKKDKSMAKPKKSDKKKSSKVEKKSTKKVKKAAKPEPKKGTKKKGKKSDEEE